MNKEMLDIVDAQDNVIGVRSLEEVYDEGLLANTRGVKLFIINKNKELLIAKRAVKKRRDAGLLDSPMTGHVQSGEDYEDALIRETAEELNLDMDKLDYRCRGKLSADDGLFSFITVYELKYEEIPDFNRDDFDKMFWIKPIDLISELLKGVKARKTMPIFLKNFYWDCTEKSC